MTNKRTQTARQTQQTASALDQLPSVLKRLDATRDDALER